MWTSFRLTGVHVGPHLRSVAHAAREIGLLRIAGDLCIAADNLRTMGLLKLAADIEALISGLDVELLLDSVTES